MKNWKIPVLALIALCCLSGLAFGQTINVSAADKWSPYGALVATVLKEAGFEPQVKFLPQARSLQYVIDGTVDAEFFRTDVAIATSANLVKVDAPLYYSDYVALTVDPAVKVASPAELKKYTVGYPRGNKIAESLTKGLANVQVADSDEALVRLLLGGRIQVAVTSSQSLQLLPKSMDASKVAIQNPPLARVPLFLVLNKNRAAWLPKIEAAFKKWVDSGKWQAELDKNS